MIFVYTHFGYLFLLEFSIALPDCFVFDRFCTVLEFSTGNDLNFYLKQHKSIPEKEVSDSSLIHVCHY